MDMNSSKQQQTTIKDCCKLTKLTMNFINVGFGECSSDVNFQGFYLCVLMQVVVQNRCTT